ncbi:hypothetical protein ACEWY4_024999 [Coilia grayii]|uniref:Fibronectin type-III domain-containing protein n=1 Tax=Coilia grayii TaxID=363190 RepID=A0ABD1IYC1_9TELE
MSLHSELQDEVAVVQDSVIKSQHIKRNSQSESECGKTASKIGYRSENKDSQSENGNPDESADNSSIQGERPRSPVPSVVSMKSDKSMGLPPEFSGEGQQHIKIHLDRPNSPGSMLDSEEDLQNFYIASEMTDGGEEVLCAICPKRAGKFCLTCVAHFCEIHVRQHYTAPALQRHNLVGVTDWERHLCDLHHRALEFFCQTDQVSICACCAVDDHRQHDVVPQGGHKSAQRRKIQIPPNIDIPPPGQVSIAAVKPEAVFLKWFGFSITASTEVPPPKNLTVETKVTSVSVKWKKPAGVAEVSYLLTLSRDEEHQTLHTDSEEHIFNHLKLEMEYTISVLTALSTGAQSKPVSKVINTCIPIPGNLEVGSVTAASASLSWSMPSEMDEIPHSFLVSYHSKGTGP